MTQTMTKLTLVAPITGRLVQPTTSDMAGFTIVPDDGNAVAPVAGTVTEVDAEALRIVITTREGMEVTVALNQSRLQLGIQPCEALVQVGNYVKAGQVLAAIDMVAIQRLKASIQVLTTIAPMPDNLEVIKTNQDVKVDTAVARLY
ncbi:PTS glucose transporter subunit IIA [Lactiplantibacillus paraxiangfangensis]|uniref:PTS glucose transporter subunit IIA n=1 Tax=Lactiplantibacillus paraxiangfangensis TaxID=3076224 RepID=UPI0030C6879E